MKKGIFVILTVLIIVINPCFASGTADNGFSFVKVVDGEDFGGLERVSAEIPKDYMLLNAYPNPFNASTVISFQLQAASYVSLDIFDVTGRTVGARHAVPLQQWMPAGSHQVVFDAEGLPSGVYFVRLEAGDFAQTMKILLVK